MKIWASEKAIRRALADANRKYKGNLEFRASGYQTESFSARGKAFLVTLGVTDAAGPGHRKAPPRQREWNGGPWKAGHRMQYACWHSHRDFLKALFGKNPEARVQSAFADYRGTDGFARDFPKTRVQSHFGSLHPLAGMNYSDLCDCPESGYKEWMEYLADVG